MTTPGSLFGPPVEPTADVTSDPIASVAPVAPPAAVQAELPTKPLRPLSASLPQEKSAAGATNVHLQDAPPTPPVAPPISAASAELPTKPRRSFGPSTRAKPAVGVAGARTSESPQPTPTDPIGADATTPDDSFVSFATVKEEAPPELPVKPARWLPAKPTRWQSTQQSKLTSPDDLLDLLAIKKESGQSELPAKPTRSQPTKQPSPSDEETRAALVENKRLAKNAKARASAAEKKVTLLEEFDKASSTAASCSKREVVLHEASSGGTQRYHRQGDVWTRGSPVDRGNLRFRLRR